ncbi:hypothetical protein V2J09_017816 [Rumex salicifolius]
MSGLRSIASVFMRLLENCATNHVKENTLVEYAFMIEGIVLSDRNLSRQKLNNIFEELLISLAKLVMYFSSLTFVPSTPEYTKIYQRFNDAKSRLEFFAPLRHVHNHCLRDYQLSSLMEEAERISATICAIISHDNKHTFQTKNTLSSDVSKGDSIEFRTLEGRRLHPSVRARRRQNGLAGHSEGMRAVDKDFYERWGLISEEGDSVSESEEIATQKEVT